MIGALLLTAATVIHPPVVAHHTYTVTPGATITYSYNCAGIAPGKLGIIIALSDGQVLNEWGQDGKGSSEVDGVAGSRVGVVVETSCKWKVSVK